MSETNDDSKFEICDAEIEAVVRVRMSGRPDCIEIRSFVGSGDDTTTEEAIDLAVKHAAAQAKGAAVASRSLFA